MHYIMFAVANRPYCLWGDTAEARTRELLQSFDPEFFSYGLALQTDVLNHDARNQTAAMSLRLLYYHVVETLFTLIGAALQAPQAVAAWIPLCKTGDLRVILSAISAEGPLLTEARLPDLSWQSVSALINATPASDPPQEETPAILYGRFWAGLARDFLTREHVNEYNSLKHGFRATPGGFRIAIGLEPAPGVPAPLDQLRSIAHSDYGSSHNLVEFIEPKDHCNVRLRHVSLNWDALATAYAIRLSIMSLNNVLAYLRYRNGLSPSRLSLTLPVDAAVFELPWRHSFGARSWSTAEGVLDEHIARFSGADILARFEGREAGPPTQSV